MKKEELLSIMDNPNLIEGIYNYCDRWCERCSMTDRCSVFLATPPLNPEDFEDEEAFMEAAFKDIGDSFQLAMELMEDAAAEQGIDLSEVENNSADVEKREAMRSEVENSAISLLSTEYSHLGRTWLKECNPSLKTLEENLLQTALMGLPDRNPEQEAMALRDALEIITYDLHQIHVKLNRAQTVRIRSDAWFDENEFPKDSDGSAKVALIGIDRSIDAWGVWLSHLADQEDSILPILSKLQQLRSLVENTFPDARAFKRPGFDD